MLSKTLAIALLLLFSQFASAQYNNPSGRVPKFMLGLSVGGKMGTTLYYGDLVDGGRVRWTVGGYADKMTGQPWLSVRASLDFGQCKGGQKDKLEFISTFGTLSAHAMFDVITIFRGYDDGRPVTPYCGVGLGGVFYSCNKNPGDDFDVEGYLKRAKEGGWSDMAKKWLYHNGGLQMCGEFSAIGGINYKYSGKLKFLLEYRGDLLFTDDFDSHQGWPDGKGGWIDSDKKFDALWTISLGVQYRFYNFNSFSNNSVYNRRKYVDNRKRYLNYRPQNVYRQRRR